MRVHEKDPLCCRTQGPNGHDFSRAFLPRPFLCTAEQALSFANHSIFCECHSIPYGRRNPRQVFEQFQEHMVVPAPAPPTEEEAAKANKRNKKQQKLRLPPPTSGVPGAAIKALGKGTGLSGWWHISPNFYVRYCLSERLKELAKADEVLRRVSLDSLNERDLREACNARAINVGNLWGGDSDSQELRRSLGEWLELTSEEVAAGSKLGPDTVFVPDRARLLGLGLNCLESSRKGRTAELSRKALIG